MSNSLTALSKLVLGEVYCDKMARTAIIFEFLTPGTFSYASGIYMPSMFALKWRISGLANCVRLFKMWSQIYDITCIVHGKAQNNVAVYMQERHLKQLIVYGRFWDIVY